MFYESTQTMPGAVMGSLSKFLWGAVCLCLSCVRASKTESIDYSQFRWYAEARDVPALELRYHEALKNFPKGEDMRSRLCFGFDSERTQDFDKVRQVFCQKDVPQISSLKDLQSALGLAIPENLPSGRENNAKPGISPGWAL